MAMVNDNNSNDIGDEFPVGMRVLAVDNDRASLFYLETLLQRCLYHVTTTTDATAVLKMLRENKFDLLISDLHMREIDGFELLKLVQRWMDIPVILLSNDDDQKLAMKAVTLGACDYFVKLVRIEELQNIWQHVIRKKMNTMKQEEDADDGKKHPSTQNKRRLIWTEELHWKFVTAVNQLGVSKAVPKKILELMNDEELTRENVASHLQKYRQSLQGKNISSKATKQVNNVSAIRSSSPGGMISRLDTPAALYVPELHSSATLQLGHAQNLNNSTNNQLNFQSTLQNGLLGLPIYEGVVPFRQAVRPPMYDMSFTPLQGGNLSSVRNTRGQTSNNVPFQGLDDQRQDGSST